MLLCGLLAVAAGVACADGDVPISQASPAVVSSSAVCDVKPLDGAITTQTGHGRRSRQRKSDDSHTSTPGETAGTDPASLDENRVDHEVTVRFVAYGDVDSDDDVPCGMLSDVHVAVVEGTKNRLNWWKTVGGSELGIEKFMPPGVRVPTTAERLSAAPAQFVTTGADGTASMVINYNPENRDYLVCVILPSDDLIAGCDHNDLRIRESISHSTVYIYFTHGYAILEVGSSDRYQRFSNGTASSAAPVTITFEATLFDDTIGISDDLLEYILEDVSDDISEHPDYDDMIRSVARPIDDLAVIVIDSAYINTWWEVVSGNGVNELEARRLRADSEMLEHDWVHVVTTDPGGLAETVLPPGDYLICSVTYWDGDLDCVYENLASGNHKFYVEFWNGGNSSSIVRQ